MYSTKTTWQSGLTNFNLYCSSAMINELLEAYREEADIDEARTVEENIYQNAD